MSGENKHVIREDEDIERLKCHWKSDPCWDIENSKGFEEYRDELLAFRQECEDEWERKRENRRKHLADLMCPLVIPAVRKCSMEKCAWWCGRDDACAITLAALRLGDIADKLPTAGRGF